MEKIRTGTTSSTKNLAWSYLELNPRLRGAKPPSAFLTVVIYQRRILLTGFDGVRPYFSWEMYTDSVRISQESHYVSVTKPNRLMLFKETIAVYCENHTN
jgi:hypothetical protein